MFLNLKRLKNSLRGWLKMHRRAMYADRRMDGILPFEVPSTRDLYIGHKCSYCDTILTQANFTKDHVIPKSSNNFPRLENTQRLNVTPACYSCNQAKGNNNLLEFLRSIGEINFGGPCSRLY